MPAPTSPVVDIPPSAFTALSVLDLPSVLEDSEALILDVRAHNAYATARLPGSLSLSVPTTLVKRPMFSLDRLTTMLQSASARERFSNWPQASRILVYDTDGASLADRPTLLGLARKFRASGFTRDIAWLKGGLHAAWRERSDLVDSSALPDEEDEALPQLMSKSLTAPPALHGKRLPQAAFGSTSSIMRRRGAPSLMPPTPFSAPGGAAPFGAPPPTTPSAFNLRLPGGTMSTLGTISQSPMLMGQRPQAAVNPFFDAVRQNLELAHRSSEEKSAGITLRLPRRVRRRVGELPFEWLRAIARRSGRMHENGGDYSDSSISDSDADADISPEHPSPPLEDGLHDMMPAAGESSESPPSAEELTKELEDQFYKIELGEQKRLMGVMEHHTGESLSTSLSNRLTASSQKQPEFPFSIIAGLEKGVKNRYKNIWPFEHARVRLRKVKPDDDDYMNASYVQPLGTTKRYIATQGPLATTFDDFWALCWEQNVHVIVMLTREVEAATVKCGKYWAEGTYGPLRLRLISTDDTPDRERKRQESESGSFFANVQPVVTTPSKRRAKKRSASTGPGSVAADAEQSTIHRIFELTNTLYPAAKPRRVTQFQFLEWPDFNVPADPRGVLHLLQDVNEAVEKARGTGDKRWGEGPLYSGPWDSASSAPQAKTATEILGHISGTSNDIDPNTGIALHALGHPPVLLHCSAGVGRTGGFIAVDAVLDGVRREMRKRREEQDPAQDAPRDAPNRPGPSRGSPESISRSSSRGAAMDIDSGLSDHAPSSEDVSASRRATPPSAVVQATMRSTSGSGLTVPMSVGGNEVHVPVAGFADAMDVDPVPQADGACRSAPDIVSGARVSPRLASSSAVPAPVLQASPALVKEVRRATLSRQATSGSQRTAYAAWREDAESSTGSHDKSKSSSSASGGGSQWGAGENSDLAALSGSGERSHLSTSPPTSFAPSSASLIAMSKKAADMSLRTASSSPKKGLPDSGLTSQTIPEAIRVESMQTTVPSVGKPHVTPEIMPELSQLVMAQLHARPSEPAESPTSRLDNWRAEVAKSPKQESHPSTRSLAPPSDARYVQNGHPVQYSRPRKLHDDVSPPLLSTYDDPIRRVIEDMREQRMSLCQSLRQYVFVHRAVIEGALIIVDEEKERAKREAARNREGAPGSSGVRNHLSLSNPRDKPAASLTNGKKVHQHSLLSPPFPAGSTILSYAAHSIPMDEDPPFSSPTASPGKSKRGPSPTELTRQDLDGAPSLLKRPSFKRPLRTPGSPSQQLAFDSLPMTGRSSSAPDARQR